MAAVDSFHWEWNSYLNGQGVDCSLYVDLSYQQLQPGSKPLPCLHLLYQTKCNDVLLDSREHEFPHSWSRRWKNKICNSAHERSAKRFYDPEHSTQSPPVSRGRLESLVGCSWLLVHLICFVWLRQFIRVSILETRGAFRGVCLIGSLIIVFTKHTTLKLFLEDTRLLM